jgi:hypothetical protein
MSIEEVTSAKTGGWSTARRTVPDHDLQLNKIRNEYGMMDMIMKSVDHQLDHDTMILLDEQHQLDYFPI